MPRVSRKTHPGLLCMGARHLHRHDVLFNASFFFCMQLLRWKLVTAKATIPLASRTTTHLLRVGAGLLHRHDLPVKISWHGLQAAAGVKTHECRGSYTSCKQEGLLAVRGGRTPAQGWSPFWDVIAYIASSCWGKNSSMQQQLYLLQVGGLACCSPFLIRHSMICKLLLRWKLVNAAAATPLASRRACLLCMGAGLLHMHDLPFNIS